MKYSKTAQVKPLRLSRRDTEQVLAALRTPPRPSNELREAALAYRDAVATGLLKVVDHIDNDVTNTVDNLQLLSNKENLLKEDRI